MGRNLTPALPDQAPPLPRVPETADIPHAWKINLEAIKTVVAEGDTGVLVIRDGRRLYRITIGRRDLDVLSQRLSMAAWKIARGKA